MIKITKTYTDYNGVERTEDFYFNLSEAELMEMETGISGGFSEMIQKIYNSKDVPSIMKVFKDLILKSYGEKTLDGRRFVKSKELSEAFSQTEAYSLIYMELSTDSDKAAEFVNGLLPKKLSDRAKELIDKNGGEMPQLSAL